MKSRFVDPYLFNLRKYEIEIIGGFMQSVLKGREILGWTIHKGWVHVCYLNDLPDYLANNHYNTPGNRR